MRYEEFERERLDPIYKIIEPYSEMSIHDRYFLNGIIRYLKPKKILEVGVSSGGGTAIILNAISDIDGSKLYSVDYSEKAYRHPDKPSGFLVDEKFSEFKDKWQIFRGGDVSRYMEIIGDDIDFLMLDTTHVHPCETLNFLCVLPFLKKNLAWTTLHDITLFAWDKTRTSLACRYLFGHVVSEEKAVSNPNEDTLGIPNIGAFKITDSTWKYINNLFESLIIPWDMDVSEKDFDDMKKIILKYYTSEQYKFFCEAYDFQKTLRDLKQRKSSFYKAAKTFIKMWQPGLYKSLVKIKNSLKKK